MPPRRVVTAVGIGMLVAGVAGCAAPQATDDRTDDAIWSNWGEDEWYVADLVGLEAVDPQGTSLGRVVAMHNFGASDIVEVAPADGGENILVAFTEAAVPEVDIENGRLVLVPPETLED